MLGYNHLYFRKQWPTLVQRNKFLLSACFQSTEIRGKLTRETKKNLHWPESLKYQNSFLDLKKKFVNTLLKIFPNYSQCLQYKLLQPAHPSADSPLPLPGLPILGLHAQSLTVSSLNDVVLQLHTFAQYPSLHLECPSTLPENTSSCFKTKVKLHLSQQLCFQVDCTLLCLWHL